MEYSHNYTVTCSLHPFLRINKKKEIINEQKNNILKCKNPHRQLSQLKYYSSGNTSTRTILYASTKTQMLVQ